MPFSRSPSVLLIDDDEANRRRVAEALSRQGWTVWEASTGQDGLAQALRGPSVALVDLHLPDMDGADVCRRLKDDPRTRVIPILHVSSSLPGTVGGEAGRTEQVADAYLSEPVDPQEVVSSLQALLRLRRAETRAEANLLQLEAVFNSMVEGVLTADRKGRILTMNPAALRLFGFQDAAQLPTTVEGQRALIEFARSDGSVLPWDDWPIARAARGEVVSGLELQVRRRDTGSSWTGSFNAIEVKLPGGLGDMLMVTFSDITDRKASEQALGEAQAKLRVYADELEQKIEERTASLRSAVSQMEEFSYTVSHDLRAPLRSIKGYADILAKDHAHRLKGEGPHYLERIIENANRMERLVNDVLTISRISNAKLKLGPLELQPILEAIVREYPSLQPNLARVTIEPLPAVIGHESLCVQVFGNLLINAAKFVQAGTFPTIRVWAERTGNAVRVYIKDNGIGIPPESHQRIFGMFERLDPENRFGGTGIGLAIVRRAVDKISGRVGVESDGRSGSCFWVELPSPEAGR